MATFNVSFLNPKLRKAGGSGVKIMSDQITMLEDELSKDGYFSPGDYDILIDRVRAVRNSGGLTPNQMSNFAVKISGYQKAREISILNKGEDMSRMDRDEKNTMANTIMMSGNNPTQFLRNRVDSLVNYINDLDSIIDRRGMAGMDVTDYLNQRTEREREYDSNINALMAAENFDGDTPIQGYVAYVKTNNNGEIVDVSYERHGKSGYAETNGMINGFQVFGKINFKEDGRNNFVLGNQRFSAVDMMIPDPANPGSFKSNKLEANVEQRGPITIGRGGFLNISGNSLKMQGYLPNNSWGKGASGSIYNRDEHGDYRKYINTREEDIDNVQGSLLNLPSSYEQAIMKNCVETFDGADTMEPDEGLPMTPISELPMTFPYTPPKTPTPQPEAPVAGRTVQPTERASEGLIPTARRTVKSGVEYLKGLFR